MKKYSIRYPSALRRRINNILENQGAPVEKLTPFIHTAVERYRDYYPTNTALDGYGPPSEHLNIHQQLLINAPADNDENQITTTKPIYEEVASQLQIPKNEIMRAAIASYCGEYEAMRYLEDCGDKDPRTPLLHTTSRSNVVIDTSAIAYGSQIIDLLYELTVLGNQRVWFSTLSMWDMSALTIRNLRTMHETAPNMVTLVPLRAVDMLSSAGEPSQTPIDLAHTKTIARTLKAPVICLDEQRARLYRHSNITTATKETP